MPLRLSILSKETSETGFGKNLQMPTGVEAALRDRDYMVVIKNAVCYAACYIFSNEFALVRCKSTTR